MYFLTCQFPKSRATYFTVGMSACGLLYIKSIAFFFWKNNQALSPEPSFTTRICIVTPKLFVLLALPFFLSFFFLSFFVLCYYLFRLYCSSLGEKVSRGATWKLLDGAKKYLSMPVTDRPVPEEVRPVSVQIMIVALCRFLYFRYASWLR